MSKTAVGDMVPAKIERKRVWEVDAGGVAVEKKAPAPVLSSGQRHYHYRLGLMAVAQFLKSRGFASTSESQTVLMYELRNSAWIDISIKNPDRIAYVTSHANYEYSSKKINAKVVTAKDMLGCEKVVQIVVTTRQGTHQPVYIPLPKDLEEPARHVASQVIRTLVLLAEKFPAIAEAFQKADPDNVPVPTELDKGFLAELPE